MKKWVVVGSIALVVMSGLFFVKYIFLDQSVVKFQIAEGVSRVDIFLTSNSKKVASLTKSGDVRLLHDGYYAVPAGDGLATDSILFTSPSANTVTIDPSYSSSRLSGIAATALPVVTALLREDYSSVMPRYSIQSFTAYGKGEWAGGLLVRNDSTQNDTKDMYRFVAHHDTTGWSLVGYPNIVLTQANYLDVPSSTLLAINTLDYTLSN